MFKMIEKISFIVISALLLAISINMFLAPHHIAAGGVSGLGIICEYVWGIDKSYIVFFLNVIMVTLSAVFLGKKVFFNTLLGASLFPLFLGIVPKIMLTSDIFLSVVFGSVIFAIGVSILYNIQASVGGTTIPPLIFEKYFGLNSSIGLLLTDSIIVIFSLYIFGMEAFLFAILSIVITSIVMTYIETGLRRKKALMVINQKGINEIKETLNKKISKDINIFEVTVSHYGKDKNMLFIVSSNRQFPLIKDTIHTVD